MGNDILAQTMLLSRETCRRLCEYGREHEVSTGILHNHLKTWEMQIPHHIQDLVFKVVYCFFKEASLREPRYMFSEHPSTTLYLIGQSDAGDHFHANMCHLVSVLPDGKTCNVQPLLKGTWTNKIVKRNIPYFGLKGAYELALKSKLLKTVYPRKV